MNEINDENDTVNLSSRSEDGEKVNLINEYIRPSSSRLSSASRRKREEQLTNEISSKSSNNFDQTLTEDQPTLSNHLHPSSDSNEIINDGPHIDNQHLIDDHQIILQIDPHNNVKSSISKSSDESNKSPLCQFRSDKEWLDLQFHPGKTDETTTHIIKRPNELENEIEDPPGSIDENILDRVQGSIIGLALGDALGAHVEFRPYEYMKNNKVKDLEGGGTWGLVKGQFTDDTSMALCLANSLLSRKDFIPYDQLVRYKWWSKYGYMSSTGQCFDIGAATSQSIHEFEYRQKIFSKDHNLPFEQLDYLSDQNLLSEFNTYCSDEDAAGNGALMRLAPVPLFFYRSKYLAVEFSGVSGQITHGDVKAYDACRYYGALIVAALLGYTKAQILAPNFYSKHKKWFGEKPLHDEIVKIAEGSFKRRRGYDDGIRGKGYIVNALEAALWAFWCDNESFEQGVLTAVNLGDDTDTTAAIYGQLAGAYYGIKKLPERWVNQIYALNYMKKLSKWIVYEGEQWHRNNNK